MLAYNDQLCISEVQDHENTQIIAEDRAVMHRHPHFISVCSQRHRPAVVIATFHAQPLPPQPDSTDPFDEADSHDTIDLSDEFASTTRLLELPTSATQHRLHLDRDKMYPTLSEAGTPPTRSRGASFSFSQPTRKDSSGGERKPSKEKKATETEV